MTLEELSDKVTSPSRRVGWIVMLLSNLMANQPGLPLAHGGQAATSASQPPGRTLDMQQ